MNSRINGVLVFWRAAKDPRFLPAEQGIKIRIQPDVRPIGNAAMVTGKRLRAEKAEKKWPRQRAADQYLRRVNKHSNASPKPSNVALCASGTAAMGAVATLMRSYQ